MKDFWKDIFDMTWDDFKFWIVVYFLIFTAAALAGYYISEIPRYIKLFQ